MQREKERRIIHAAQVPGTETEPRLLPTDVLNCPSMSLVISFFCRRQDLLSPSTNMWKATTSSLGLSIKSLDRWAMKPAREPAHPLCSVQGQWACAIHCNFWFSHASWLCSVLLCFNYGFQSAQSLWLSSAHPIIFRGNHSPLVYYARGGQRAVECFSEDTCTLKQRPHRFEIYSVDLSKPTENEIHSEIHGKCTKGRVTRTVKTLCTSFLFSVGVKWRKEWWLSRDIALRETNHNCSVRKGSFFSGIVSVCLSWGRLLFSHHRCTCWQ